MNLAIATRIGYFFAAKGFFEMAESQPILVGETWVKDAFKIKSPNSLFSWPRESLAKPIDIEPVSDGLLYW